MTARLFAVTPRCDGVVSGRIATDDAPYVDAQWVDGFASMLGELARDTTVRVVILEGDERYFSAGANKSALSGAQEWDALHYAARVAPALLGTPLPVIAAAAGHAIGGGLLVALWCDVILLAEESLYGASFMTLGFTPGVGATQVVPEAFGEPLGRELLLTGRMLTGREIKSVCCPVSHTVVPRAEVMSRALAIAGEIAEAPRESIMLLKRNMAARRSRGLTDVLQAEKEAHTRLFADPAIVDEIRRRYPSRLALGGSEPL